MSLRQLSGVRLPTLAHSANLAFWDWVKLRDHGVTFPNDALVQGKFQGPSIGVGPAMTSHIMKASGKIEDHLTVPALTPMEHINATLFWQQQEFLASMQDQWGPKTTVKDLGPDVLNLTPDLENTYPWEDNDGPLFPKTMISRPQKQLGTSL